MDYCANCGEKEYNGACTNCHEAVYIEQQYVDLEMYIPESIGEKADEHRKDIEHNRVIKETF